MDKKHSIALKKLGGNYHREEGGPPTPDEIFSKKLTLYEGENESFRERGG
jgi:hypothetical protein